MRYVGDMAGGVPYSGTDSVDKGPYVFSVSSGKEGVGATNTVINLAVEIQRRGHRVLVFDANLGFSSIPLSLCSSIPRNAFLSGYKS